ncbi:MAG: 50S ribosomal protein L11 methyltransferase [Acidimicrobiales bacterium]|nr:50S ribosomal protein L11 methyltransferase [Acidimicrobiales bacterium]
MSEPDEHPASHTDPTGPTELPDWALAQREHLEPAIVGRFGVHPPWCRPVGRVQVSIDPGPTFGHGSHPSTVLVLAELDQFGPEGRSVLDVGCGSGVLAISAAMAGAGSVVAVDVDPDAVAWTRFNAEANGVSLDASTAPVADLGGPFELVLANVLPSVHAELAADLVRLTADGGTLVVSGIPEERADEVAVLYVAAGAGELVPEHRNRFDGWTALTFSKNGR